MKSKKTKRDALLDAAHGIPNRFGPLDDWLIKHNAVCMWQRSTGRPPAEEHGTGPRGFVECWRIGAGLVLVHRYTHGNAAGWDIYTAGESNEIDKTLRDAEKRLGIK